MSAYKTGEYRNYFELIGKSREEADKRLEETWQQFFYGSEEDRIFHPVGDDMGYLTDTGNNDVRTEGMSYGMMYCVQTNHKEEFDRIWKWAYTYMWQKQGREEGYFAWSCSLDGKHNAEGAAPDGEEFFAMSLFFASHRWGDGEGIYEYSKHARAILSACLHKGENGRDGAPMWNKENKQVLFVAGADFTDPSYHLPHFYELFALWANEEDRDFFKEAAEASRKYLVTACHPATGMSPEYAEFDGKPFTRKFKWPMPRHDWFFSDSYRTVANIGLDYEWFGKDLGQCAAAANMLAYFDTLENYQTEYEIDGTQIPNEAHHPIALQSGSTQGMLAFVGNPAYSDEKFTELAKRWLEKFWNTPLRDGQYRYYDNCLYLFAMLALSGNYRIY